jgi:FKBP-type peptidyl-prolyl cis-trans isomerase SlyD
MHVEPDVWVTLRYRLFDSQGEPVEEGEREWTYLHGGYGSIFEKIEASLDGQAVGFTTSLYLEPEDTFGDYDAQRLRVEPRDRFPDHLEAGMTFEGVPGDEAGADAALDSNAVPGAEPGEEPPVLIYTVTDVTDEAVVLDGNHPLAGMALRFEIQIEDLRAATLEEIEAEQARLA